MDADAVHMVCRFVINTRNERTTNKLIEYPTQTEDLFESIVCNKSPSLSPLHLKLNSLLKVTGQGDSRRDEQTTVIIHRTCRLNYIIWIWGHSAMDGGWWMVLGLLLLLGATERKFIVEIRGFHFSTNLWIYCFY